MNEYLHAKLLRIKQLADKLEEHTQELIFETIWVEVGRDGRKGGKDS